MFRKQQPYDYEIDDRLYGTPFPPIEDPSQNASKKQELDLTVRDEKGRRRFHGAFTGGFSAGFFNSVDTKDGWQPKQFLSRKNERSKKQNFKPEDFMDDEDFSEFGIAPKLVKAKEQFQSTTDSFAGFRENLNQKSELKLDDVLRDVVRLKSVSIGLKILKRMKNNAIKKITKDNYLDNDRIFPLEFDENELKSFFLNPKKNFNGLGYKGLKSSLTKNTEQTTTNEFSTVMKDGKKLKITGEAFGYGALDEDDGYEAEIYTFDDLSKYDYQLGGKQIKQSTSTSLLSSFISDTHLMDDFRKSDEYYLIKNEHENINVPKNWRPKPPIHSILNRKRKSRWDNNEEDNFKNEIKNLNFKKLNAIERAEILGESSTSLEKEEINIKLNKIKEENLKKSNEIDEEKIEIKNEEQEKLIPKFKKPLTGFFASKFIQSDNTPLDEYKPGLNKIENLTNLVNKNNSIKSTTDKEEIKSFVGKSNREIYQWHPHKLVCKRFNVSIPYPQFPDVVGVLAMTKSKEGKIIDSVLPSSFTSRSANQLVTTNKLSNKMQQQNESTIKQDDDKIEEFKKPDMNLFKSVFNLSDDDDDLDISDIEEKDEITIDNLKDTEEENKKDEIKLNEPQRILFNKAFIKKSETIITNKKLEIKSSKISLNLFENEVDSDEELIDFVKKPIKKENFSTFNKKESINDYKEDSNSLINKKEQNKFEDKRDINLKYCKDNKSNDNDLLINNKEMNNLKNNLINKISNKSDSDSDLDFIDEFVDDIINIDQSNLDKNLSSHKKKRKKHKEHKKHKKKKHKSDRKLD